ncbi:MAG TPA: UbiA-like polyprenyltransferase [Thermoanaerobaculia bacterium]|nr:UbiA-like polyprenyltransferase [Thermoanaerobaculia bacterium]
MTTAGSLGAAPRSFAGRLRLVLEMIQFEHTLFALPFAFLGMVLAAGGLPPWRTIGWIAVAMVGARSAAMAFNRLVDRRLDAANPRTAGRALPAGELRPGFVAAFVVASCGLLVLAAWRLNPLALALSPLALAVLLLYSYSKRFTALCHLWLGLALAGAPLGAWIAVRGDVGWTPALLAAVVVCWVAGFDVLYALQDVELDRRAGLSSLPARVGVGPALVVSALLHALMLVLLALLPRVYPPGLGGFYWLGVAGCGLLLVYQHWIVRPGDLSRLNAAFFTANGALSAWLFLATTLDVLRPG